MLLLIGFPLIEVVINLCCINLGFDVIVDLVVINFLEKNYRKEKFFRPEALL
jgi:hypothetical protein